MIECKNDCKKCNQKYCVKKIEACKDCGNKLIGNPDKTIYYCGNCGESFVIKGLK